MKVLCECGVMQDIDPRHIGTWIPSKTMAGRIKCFHYKEDNQK